MAIQGDDQNTEFGFQRKSIQGLSLGLVYKLKMMHQHFQEKGKIMVSKSDKNKLTALLVITVLIIPLGFHVMATKYLIAPLLNYGMPPLMSSVTFMLAAFGLSAMGYSITMKKLRKLESLDQVPSNHHNS